MAWGYDWGWDGMGLDEVGWDGDGDEVGWNEIG